MVTASQHIVDQVSRSAVFSSSRSCVLNAAFLACAHSMCRYPFSCVNSVSATWRQVYLQCDSIEAHPESVNALHDFRLYSLHNAGTVLLSKKLYAHRNCLSHTHFCIFQQLQTTLHDSFPGWPVLLRRENKLRCRKNVHQVVVYSRAKQKQYYDRAAPLQPITTRVSHANQLRRPRPRRAFSDQLK